jgi:hypothetical protein
MMKEMCCDNLKQRFEQLVNPGFIYFQDVQTLYGDIQDLLNVLNIKSLELQKSNDHNSLRQLQIQIAEYSRMSSQLENSLLEYWFSCQSYDTP